MYGLEVWGACQAKYLKRLSLIQKKAIRAISKSHWYSHSEPRMKKLKILKIEDQHYFQCSGLIFDMLKGLAPDIYNLSTRNKSNIQCTRSATNKPENLRLPSFNPTQLKKTFSGHAPEFWNTLPKEIQNADSRSLFKSLLKKSILDQYAEDVNCSNPRCPDRRFHTAE